MNGVLVLARKPGESVKIEGVGKITYVENKAGMIKLAFHVDRRYRVFRSELLEDEPNPSNGRNKSAA